MRIKLWRSWDGKPCNWEKGNESIGIISHHGNRVWNTHTSFTVLAQLALIAANQAESSSGGSSRWDCFHKSYSPESLRGRASLTWAHGRDVLESQPAADIWLFISTCFQLIKTAGIVNYWPWNFKGRYSISVTVQCVVIGRRSSRGVISPKAECHVTCFWVMWLKAVFTLLFTKLIWLSNC